MSFFFPGEVVPFAAVVLGIGAGVVAMVLKHREKKALLEAYHRERLVAVERGTTDLPPMPPELVGLLQGKPAASVQEMTGGVYLLVGLVLLLGGIALCVSLSLIAGPKIGFFGLIPAAVGLANLLYYYVLRRNAARV